MNDTPEIRTRSEIRDGMRIEWQVPIPMKDGIVLRADVFRPIRDGRYPVVLSHGVYAKGLAYQDAYPMQWEKMVKDHRAGGATPACPRPAGHISTKEETP